MIRSKLLLLLLSGALIFGACSESGTDPDDPNDPDNGDEPIEPTASVNNPEDDATLEGEVTFSIDGESENGFSEARIFVGDEQVETVEDPSLPHDQTITTHEYDNGDYDLRAELDVAEQDTSIETSVSATFENYMVTMETDGYIASLKENNDASYLFISDPDGNVMQEMELTAQSDGVLQLLPPEEIEGDIPEHYSLTVAHKTNSDLYIYTDTGLEPWARLYQYGSVSEDPATKELTVELNNFSQTPDYAESTMESSDWWYGEASDGSIAYTFDYNADNEHLFTTHGSYETEGYIPGYKWEKNIDELSDSHILEYDVQNDFQQMVTQDVSIPEGIATYYYYQYMSVEPSSWDAGNFSLPVFYGDFVEMLGLGVSNDANDNEGMLGMYVPDYPDHLFRTYLYAIDTEDTSIRYYQRTIGDLPTELNTLDTEIQYDNVAMDNLEFEVTGNTDYVTTVATNNTDSYYHSWEIRYAPSAESVVFPKIADSLDQSINNFSRSDFSFGSTELHQFSDLDGYEGYLSQNFGAEQDTFWGDEYYRKERSISSSNKMKRSFIEPQADPDHSLQIKNDIRGLKDSR